MSINCTGPGCKIRLGRHRPGKVVQDEDGQLRYTRDPDAVDVRRLRRVRKARSAAPQPAPVGVVYLPADDPRMALGGYRQRPDGSFRWTGVFANEEVQRRANREVQRS
jgi:hypothetical protein